METASNRANKFNVANTLTTYHILDQYKKQEGICFYCLDSISLNKYTVDHLVSFKDGGANIPENIVCSCFRCNMKKGRIPYKDALLILRSEGELKWCNPL